MCLFSHIIVCYFTDFCKIQLGLLSLPAPCLMDAFVPVFIQRNVPGIADCCAVASFIHQAGKENKVLLRNVFINTALGFLQDLRHLGFNQSSRTGTVKTAFYNQVFPKSGKSSFYLSRDLDLALCQRIVHDDLSCACSLDMAASGILDAVDDCGDFCFNL